MREQKQESAYKELLKKNKEQLSDLYDFDEHGNLKHPTVSVDESKRLPKDPTYKNTYWPKKKN
jgi:hypothetical protein